MHPDQPPAAVLEAFALTFGRPGPHAERVTSGLIHRTYCVNADQGRFALQGLSSIFAPELELDYAATTAHLALRGLVAPALVPTPDGRRTVVHDGVRWRLLTWIPGRAFDRVPGPEAAREAGRALGALHRALADFPGPLRAVRLGVHDTPRHLAGLRGALAAHPDHPAHAEVAELADEIWRRIDPLPELDALPDRYVHGDPKISNLLFDETGARAEAWIDLDTIAPMKLPLELGDALRSWANPLGEDGTSPRFDPAIFAAALHGYAAGAPGYVTKAEQDAIAQATRTIMLELGARFLADALNDRYFGWNPALFPSRSTHNLHRARVQVALARDFDAQRPALDDLVASAFGGR